MNAIRLLDGHLVEGRGLEDGVVIHDMRPGPIVDGEEPKPSTDVPSDVVAVVGQCIPPGLLTHEFTVSFRLEPADPEAGLTIDLELLDTDDALELAVGYATDIRSRLLEIQDQT